MLFHEGLEAQVETLITDAVGAVGYTCETKYLLRFLGAEGTPPRNQELRFRRKADEPGVDEPYPRQRDAAQSQESSSIDVVDPVHVRLCHMGRLLVVLGANIGLLTRG